MLVIDVSCNFLFVCIIISGRTSPSNRRVNLNREVELSPPKFSFNPDFSPSLVSLPPFFWPNTRTHVTVISRSFSNTLDRSTSHESIQKVSSLVYLRTVAPSLSITVRPTRRYHWHLTGIDPRGKVGNKSCVGHNFANTPRRIANKRKRASRTSP